MSSPDIPPGTTMPKKKVAAKKAASKKASGKPAGMSATDWQMVQSVARKYGIDPLIFVAIGMHETGWGTLGQGRPDHGALILGVGAYSATNQNLAYSGLRAQLEGAAKILNNYGVETVQDLASGVLAPHDGHIRYAEDLGWTQNVISVYNDLAGGNVKVSADVSAYGGSGGPGQGGASGGTGATPELSFDDLAAAYGLQTAFLLDHPTVKQLVKQAAEEGWTTEVFQGHLRNTPYWKHVQGPLIEAQIRQIGSDYAIPVSEKHVREWTQRVLAGDTVDSWRERAAERATSLYPYLADNIAKGETVAQYADAYGQIAVNTLGINPLDVDFTHPKWRDALTQVDEKGQRVPMSLSDWESHLMTAPKYGWDSSQNAMGQAAEFTTQLESLFGSAG